MKRSRDTANIVPILGACITPETCCIIMQFMEQGSLHDLLHNRRVLFTLEQNVRILKDVANGMCTLHAFDPPIIHRYAHTHLFSIDTSCAVCLSKLYTYITEI